jgi:single-strand DNA-binding protein
MYNKVVLVGNLTRDVEIRYSQSGSAVGNVGIATSRKWKSQTGEQKDEVMFIDLTFFGRTAEIANQYLRKGSKVLVDGRLQFQQWTAQDGSKRSKHSVTVENLQMLDSKADSMNQNSGYGEPMGSNNSMNNNYNAPQQSNYQDNGYNPNQGYSQQTQTSQQASPYGQPQQNTQPSVPEIDIDDDEIPF